VDTSIFCKKDIAEKDNSVINIGTIKSLEEKYGIIYIIDAAKILVEKRKDLHFKFFLIGSGKDLETYRQRIINLGLIDFFELPGRIAHSEISKFHNLLDIFLNVSIDDSESFGVATVEAMACEKPVIVSDVGGLVEVVNRGEFGVIVPRK